MFLLAEFLRQPDELRDEAVVGDLEVVHEFAHEVGDTSELSEPHLIGEHITGGELAQLPRAAGLCEPCEVRGVILRVVGRRPLVLPAHVLTRMLHVTLVHIVKLHHLIKSLRISFWSFVRHLSQAAPGCSLVRSRLSVFVDLRLCPSHN